MDDLALIILNYNSTEDTILCVNQLLSFKSDFHIIIVDNLSPDGSYSKLRTVLEGLPFVDLIQAPSNGGYSSGNNLGIRYAASHYSIKVIGILNPDVYIPSLDILKNMKSALMSNDKYAIIGGSALNGNGDYNPNSSAWSIPSSTDLIRNHFILNQRHTKVQTLKMIGNGLAQAECVVGCFFLARLSVIQELGFLDENVFLYNEENILGIKCKRKGYMELVALDQFYIHNHKEHSVQKLSLKKLISASKIGYQSRQYLCKTYYSPRLLPLLWMVEMGNRMYLFLSYIKNRIKPNL